MEFTRTFNVPFDLFDRMCKRAISCVKRHERKRGRRHYDDCYVLEDCLGPSQVLFYVSSLEVLTPSLVSDLQKTLAGYAHWEIVVIICPPEESSGWPEMGLYIRENEIIDALRREYFPKESQGLSFEGARPGTADD